MKKTIMSTDEGFEVPRIDTEFLNLLPFVDTKEDQELEVMLIEEGGARDPIIVWTEENIVVEGHRRSRLCQKHGLPYKVEYKSFADREAVKTWMFRHQLHGRRNLNDQQTIYYLGQLYNKTDATAAEVAKKAKTTSRTVFRASKFAKAVDAHEAENPGARKKILAGEAGKSAAKIIELAPVLCKRCTRVGAVKGCANCTLAREAKAARKPLPARDLFDEKEVKKKIKAETPAKDDWQDLLDTWTKLSGMLTAALKRTGPHGEVLEETERLRDYMTWCGLVEYPKAGADPKCVALSGVRAVMELSRKKGPKLKAPEVEEHFKKACGAVPYVPPKTKFNRKRGG